MRDQLMIATTATRPVWNTIESNNAPPRAAKTVPTRGGAYTIDFCCVALKLIIEVDGVHHQTEEGRRHDQHRDRCLADLGYHVVRIPGYEVLRDAAAVRRQIEHAIDERIS